MTHRIAFRHQRAIFVFVVLGLIVLYSTAVLWGHYERIVTNYQWLAKAGLALVDVIAIGLAIWHLYTHHAPLKVWCYVADAVIAAVMLVHAGAVLQMDSSGAQQRMNVQTAAEVQAKIEGERVKAAGQAAAAIKRETGSSRLANQALRTGKESKGASDVIKAATEIKPATFLSEGYMEGGVYYWPALTALFFFVVAIGISAFSLPFEDRNHNGIPDFMEAPERIQASMADREGGEAGQLHARIMNAVRAEIAAAQAQTQHPRNTAGFTPPVTTAHSAAAPTNAPEAATAQEPPGALPNAPRRRGLWARITGRA